MPRALSTFSNGASSASKQYFHRKSALVVGVANHRSLGWASALSLLENGFDDVVITYQNERQRNTINNMILKQNDIYNQEYDLKSKIKKCALSNRLEIYPELLHLKKKRISCFQCDITDEVGIRLLFEEIMPHHLQSSSNENEEKDEIPFSLENPSLDAMVHSVAFAPASAMKPDISTKLSLLNTSLGDYNNTHEASAYSLLTLSRFALPLLSSQACVSQKENNLNLNLRSSSITALTYLGSTRAVPNYNIMGSAKASLEALVRGLAQELGPPPHNIRVNAVSAGPVNTLAARGIRGFTALKEYARDRTFLKRDITAKEVGDVVSFLAGDGFGNISNRDEISGVRAGGVTGQVIYCDAGYSSFG